jgi:Raf kinase inhibitor-like YbhB/YbcL family protein
MKLLSTAFNNFDTIPVKYTAEGEDICPPLRWQDIPEGTRSFALVCEDPDAPGATWDHLVLYNIPPTMKVLPEGFNQLTQGIQSCLNSWGKKGYGGPNPPSGTHRYFFIVYALDTVLQLPDGARKVNLLKEMQGHVLAEASVVGVYQLQRSHH